MLLAKTTKLCSRNVSSHIRQRQTRFDVCKTPNSSTCPSLQSCETTPTAMFACIFSSSFASTFFLHQLEKFSESRGDRPQKTIEKEMPPSKRSSGVRSSLTAAADRKSPLSLNDVNCLQLKNEQLFSFSYASSAPRCTASPKWSYSRHSRIMTAQVLLPGLSLRSGQTSQALERIQQKFRKLVHKRLEEMVFRFSRENPRRILLHSGWKLS